MNAHPVWSFIQRRKKQSLLIVFFGLLTQALTLMIPVSVGRYYQLAFDFSGSRTQLLSFIPEGWWHSIPTFLLFFSALIVLRYGCFVIYQYLLKRDGELFLRRIRNDLFAHQLSVHYAVYQEKGIGKYLLRYSGDLNSLKNLYVKGSLSIVPDVSIVVVALAWFFVLSPMGAMMIVLGVVSAFWVVRWFNLRIETQSMQKRDRTAGQLSLVSRTLNAILTVSMMNKQATEAKKYRRRSRAIMDSANRYHRWFVLNNGFIAFLQYGLLVAILWVFYQSPSPVMDGANLTSFILLYITVLPIISRLFRLPTVFHLGKISVNKLRHIYTLKTESLTDGEEIGDQPRVDFQQIGVGDETINLTVQPNVVNDLALPPTVSPQAIVLWLTGVERCSRGEILVDDKPIDAYALSSRRAMIAVASRQLPLLGRTVYEAITAARSQRIKADSQRWLAEAQAQLEIPEVQRLLLDDRIGENGSALSVMQYELLCLVRGLNNDKPLLICEPMTLLPAATVKPWLRQTGKTIIWLS